MLAFQRRTRPQLLLFLLLVSGLFSAGVARNFPDETSQPATTGWKIKFDESGSSPVIADDVLYVGPAGGLLAAAQENKTTRDAQSSTRQQDQTDKNLAGLKKKLSALETTKGKQHPDLMPVLDAICRAHREQGAYVTALPFAQQALEIERKVHGESDIAVAGALDFLGTFDLLAGDNKAAVENYQLARPIVEKNLGTEHPAYAMLLVHMGTAYLADGRIEAAESALQKAKQALVKGFGPAAQEVTAAQEILGDLYLKKGGYSRSEQELQYALAVRSEGLEFRPNDMTEADVLLYMAPLQNLLGALYTTVGLYDQAGPLLKDALKAYEAKLDKKHPLLEGVLVNLAALAEAKGDTVASDGYQKRAESIHKEHLGISHLATVPLPRPDKAVVPSKEKLGPMANSHVGDWVSYAGPDGAPSEQKKIIRSTPVVVVVSNSFWDTQKKEWDSGSPRIVGLAATAKELYGASEGELKAEKMDIKGQQVEVACATVPAGAESKQCKACFARDIPVGGLAKMECDGKLIMRVLDYRRGE
jgi:tetratricopeptide (TPR) repeat protein